MCKSVIDGLVSILGINDALKQDNAYRETVFCIHVYRICAIVFEWLVSSTMRTVLH